MIADLNCPGEVITLIDPNADVIKDPAVQKIFKSLDGERTVVIIIIYISVFNSVSNLRYVSTSIKMIYIIFFMNQSAYI